MRTKRYKELTRIIKAERRLLLTGTPLQNNLLELMSLLAFVMPRVFGDKIEHLQSIFSDKRSCEDGAKNFYTSRVAQAKQIMQPFVLRRLKNDVLQQLPGKQSVVKLCPLPSGHRARYDSLVNGLSAQFASDDCPSEKASGMLMQLRKMANHPLLHRLQYTDDKLLEMARILIEQPSHQNANEKYVFEDMQVMSDFELHKLCQMYKSLNEYSLSPEDISYSGKFHYLDQLLRDLKKEGTKVLLFSQFTMMMDVVEDYLNICGYTYIRLDGSVKMQDRQKLIDDYNSNDDIFIFLLSTRAGGLGINLTSASTVIIHDIDFNPYNDKQAEDRCHRVGQTKEVTVIRLIAEGTVEEAMFQCAEKKLQLGKHISEGVNEADNTDTADVASLLHQALHSSGRITHGPETPYGEDH